MNRSDVLNDLRTGFLVSIVALPLCLGISMASGFPAASGLVTAIIAGLFASWFGGARLSIKGPAAGLIVIVLAGVMELGGGDPALGYQKLLAAIAVSGLLQVLLGMLRLGRFSAIIPPSVVHGMLAGIGVIIFAKQFPVMLGVAPIAKTPLGLMAEIPHTIANLNPAVAGLGLVSLIIMLGFGRLPARISSRIPPQLVALAVAVPAALLLDFSHAHELIVSGEHFKVGPQYLVRIPADIIKSLGFPEWRSLLDPLTWKFVVLLTMVGSAESLLTVHAVDALDPERRVSDNDADLIAIGVGNFLAGLAGGLPMISEIVRSRANIDNGAKGSTSNFFHGLFLAAALFLVPGLLNTIPLSVLAAMLLVTAWRLASPSEFAKVFRIGSDQFAIFVVTMVLTVSVDLLVGVSAGVLLKLGLHVVRGLRFRDFLSPGAESRIDAGTLYIDVKGAAVFSNFLKIQGLIVAAPGDVERVIVNFSDAGLVDHTTLERLHSLGRTMRGRAIEFTGLDLLQGVSGHELATRRAGG